MAVTILPYGSGAPRANPDKPEGYRINLGTEWTTQFRLTLQVGTKTVVIYDRPGIRLEGSFSAYGVIPTDILQGMPNNLVARGTIRAYFGSTLKASTVVDIRADYEISSPTISGVTWTDQNPNTSPIGAFVQGHSKIKGVIQATAKHWATLKTKTLTIDGANYSDGYVWSGEKSGVISASARVIDSRTLEASKVSNFTVLPYTNPRISNFVVHRVDAAGNPDPSGLRIGARVVSKISSLMVAGLQKNNSTIVISTRFADEAWVVRKTISGALDVDQLVVLDGGEIFDATKSYDVRVSLKDAIQSEALAFSRVLTEAVTYDLNGTHVGIGKYWEKGALDVGGVVHATEFQDQAGMGGLAPTGSILEFAGEVAPEGWLFCNGQTLSISAYPNLYSVLGTRSGAGSGMFKLPDRSGRFGVGINLLETEFNTLGKTGGAKTHTLTTGQIPALSGTAASSGAHTHSLSGTAASAGSHTHGVPGSHTRFMTTDRTSVFSPRVAPTAVATGTTAAVPAYGAQTAVGVTSTVASAGAHTHSISGTAASAGAHTHSVTVGSGAADPHNNLPPYIAHNYIIKT